MLFVIDRLGAGSRRSELRVQVERTHSWETTANTHSSVPSYLLLDPNLYLPPLTSTWGIYCTYRSLIASWTYRAAHTPAKLCTLAYTLTHVCIINIYTHKSMMQSSAFKTDAKQ